MSDISISVNSPLSMALDNVASGAESTADQSSTVLSGLNAGGADSSEQAIAGSEIASSTEDFLGSGPDLSTSGSDPDVAQALAATLNDGMGSIADKIG